MLTSITEVELRNALRIDDDDLARGAIDENIFIPNRGAAARVDIEYESQERGFASFYLPTSFTRRNIWGHFSPTIATLCWIEETFFAFIIIGLFTFFQQTSLKTVYENLNVFTRNKAAPSLNDLLSQNTIIFIMIIQLTALASCSLIGLAIKAMHRVIGHAVEDIKLNFIGPEDWTEMEWSEGTVLIRTVDSTRVFIGKSNSTNRFMKVEALLTNCSPKQVDRDAVALVRSKMSRLVTMEHYDETMRDTGLRRMKTKLEVRVPCYTGQPKSLATQKLLPSGMRYTRREVFRLSNKVVDNQVVTECYIQSRKSKRKFFSFRFKLINCNFKRTQSNRLVITTVLTTWPMLS